MAHRLRAWLRRYLAPHQPYQRPPTPPPPYEETTCPIRVDPIPGYAPVRDRNPYFSIPPPDPDVLVPYDLADVAGWIASAAAKAPRGSVVAVAASYANIIATTAYLYAANGFESGVDYSTIYSSAVRNAYDLQFHILPLGYRGLCDISAGLLGLFELMRRYRDSPVDLATTAHRVADLAHATARVIANGVAALEPTQDMDEQNKKAVDSIVATVVAETAAALTAAAQDENNPSQHAPSRIGATKVIGNTAKE
ncbi:uncharacterized protein B0T15DRAFT_541572 [Chaetomium strumarium]|uniref:Uncharacterized protein n=1 Tax=Chaetomium strumarium TaxID=1170767 RepID=A0AAJ0GL79_9PEZI|nr:hypothetical protein B0T15DRAFT_541572 [Chaetomium strumarium]